MRQIVIINYNTPELTEACILSLRKTGCDWPIIVFDNSKTMTFPSDEGLPIRTYHSRPFLKNITGVTRIDNTENQYIDFDKELSSYIKTNAHGSVNAWGSDRHMMTIQKLFELLPDGFILVESDTLVKKDIRELWQEEYSFVGYVKRDGPYLNKPRILPMLCYLNVPKFRELGVDYFDPERSWMLHECESNPNNWYDTGASLLEDVLSHRPNLKGLSVDITQYIVHLGGASYRQQGRDFDWLKQHKDLWTFSDETVSSESLSEIINTNNNNYDYSK